MSIKIILCIPETPLFIAFAGAKNFGVIFDRGDLRQIIRTGLNPT